jgi:DNA recombination protein RmuC
MEIVQVLLLVTVVGAAVALAAVELTRRRSGSAAHPGGPDVDGALQRVVASALAELRSASAAERDAAVHAALQHAAVLQREQLGSTAAQIRETLEQAAALQREQLGAATTLAREQAAADLGAKHDVIDTRLDQVQTEMRAEMAKLGSLVNSLAETSAQKFGQVDQSLRSHAEITQTLNESARALREAMASPTARGQWGERMAEDVLRLAGFVENVNYHKQTQIEGGTGRPDFTFPLPKGHELYMDVKFPMAGYLRYLEAGTDAERQAHRATFLRDVRARIKELARRDYANESAKQSVDYVLLFLPNEQLTGFIHEHDPGLIDDAMGQRVVMCSPLTLFAFLGVIRQAYDNFVIEQTSDQILGLMGKFATEWQKYTDELDKLKRRFEQLDRQFDTVVGTRRRQLEKPLLQIDDMRRERNLPIDGQLFGELEGETGERDDASDATPPNVRRLGA